MILLVIYVGPLVLPEAGIVLSLYGQFLTLLYLGWRHNDNHATLVFTFESEMK